MTSPEPILVPWFMVLCDRWIDEIAGTRCVLSQGHDGLCAALGEPTDGRA